MCHSKNLTLFCIVITSTPNVVEAFLSDIAFIASIKLFQCIFSFAVLCWKKINCDNMKHKLLKKTSILLISLHRLYVLMQCVYRHGFLLLCPAVLLEKLQYKLTMVVILNSLFGRQYMQCHLLLHFQLLGQQLILLSILRFQLFIIGNCLRKHSLSYFKCFISHLNS